MSQTGQCMIAFQLTKCSHKCIYLHNCIFFPDILDWPTVRRNNRRTTLRQHLGIERISEKSTWFYDVIAVWWRKISGEETRNKSLGWIWGRIDDEQCLTICDLNWNGVNKCSIDFFLGLDPISNKRHLKNI